VTISDGLVIIVHESDMFLNALHMKKASTLSHEDTTRETSRVTPVDARRAKQYPRGDSIFAAVRDPSTYRAPSSSACT
jgi:hypothetical protein